MDLSKIWYSVLVFVAFSCSASAAVSDLKYQLESVPESIIPGGYITYDFFIDFDGGIPRQQIALFLDQGSLYDSPVGGYTPPNDALLSFPSLSGLEFDTFVALGGFTQEESENIIVVEDVCNELFRLCTRQHSSPGLAIAWAPDVGSAVPSSGEDYPIARITFSHDAYGILYYFGSTGDGDPPLLMEGGFINGVIPELTKIVPEPTSLALFSLAAIGLAATQRRAMRA